MHYSSIQSAILSGTAILQTLKGLASMKLETKTVEQISTVQERISDMIAVLVGTQEELIKLLKENRELRDQLKATGRWFRVRGRWYAMPMTRQEIEQKMDELARQFAAGLQIFETSIPSARSLSAEAGEFKRANLSTVFE
jgi:regulator of replication initiation timing